MLLCVVMRAAEKQEYKNLQKALECSRNTLTFVNKEVRECENRQRLEDVYSRLDTSSMPKDFVVSEYIFFDNTSVIVCICTINTFLQIKSWVALL